MVGEFQVSGTNKSAAFTLKLHRGDGMLLLAMNWKKSQPPKDFVGLAIEYKEPKGSKFFSLQNRLAFPGNEGSVNPNTLSTRLSPIQKFRWVHFPRNADMTGAFEYRVAPAFMNTIGELSYGEAQEAAIELQRETYSGQLNVTYTRGFVSSQAFVDRYGADAIATLLPAKADMGLDFLPTHPKADEALAWMGFEARSAILEVLDQTIADKKAQVRAVVYDLNEPGIVSRMEEPGSRLQIIIDDDGAHGEANSSETLAAQRLRVSAAPHQEECRAAVDCQRQRQEHAVEPFFLARLLVPDTWPDTHRDQVPAEEQTGVLIRHLRPRGGRPEGPRHPRAGSAKTR